MSISHVGPLLRLNTASKTLSFSPAEPAEENQHSFQTGPQMTSHDPSAFSHDAPLSISLHKNHFVHCDRPLRRITFV